MISTRWTWLAAGLASLGLAAVPACSKSSDNGNKGAAHQTTPAPAPTAAAPAPATPPAPAATAPATPRSETPQYVAEIVAPAAVTAGAEAAVTVKVTPKPGWHFNLEFPTSVTVEAPAGVTVAKPKQTLADAVEKSEEKGASWAVKLVPAKAGEGVLRASLKFAVCTDTTCDPKRETLALRLETK
ncbi:MAG: hypothetical protein D6689_02685 [Deltaproteobacteria bacterium]|nr:MAG: hypothetical protein D6689_02685 [Deltaproteobacteria bacterium]